MATLVFIQSMGSHYRESGAGIKPPLPRWQESFYLTTHADSPGTGPAQTFAWSTVGVVRPDCAAPVTRLEPHAQGESKPLCRVASRGEWSARGRTEHRAPLRGKRASRRASLSAGRPPASEASASPDSIALPAAAGVVVCLPSPWPKSSCQGVNTVWWSRRHDLTDDPGA